MKPASNGAPAPELLLRFASIVGEKYAVTDPAVLEPLLVEGCGLYQGRSAMLLRPGSVGEVAAILMLANETGTPLVPQGGNTGLVGGQIPFHGEVLLSHPPQQNARDRSGPRPDLRGRRVLAKAQEAAAKVERLFPL